MSVKICPKCKSIMVDGRCTNKNCGVSELSIDTIEKLNSAIDYFKPKYHKFLDGAMMFIDGDILEHHEKLNASDSLCGFRWYVPTYKEVKELGLKVDVKFIVNADANKDKYCVRHMQETNLKEARKYIKRVCRYILKLTWLTDKNDILYEYLGSNDGVKWDVITNRYGLTEAGRYSLVATVDCALAIAYSKFENWFISIKENDGVSIIYQINRDIANEVFKLRKVKDGNKRRTMLRNLIHGYKKGIDKNIEVKEHFRGQQEFEWDDMKVILYPPINLVNKCLEA